MLGTTDLLRPHWLKIYIVVEKIQIKSNNSATKTGVPRDIHREKIEKAIIYQLLGNTLIYLTIIIRGRKFTQDKYRRIANLADRLGRRVVQQWGWTVRSKTPPAGSPDHETPVVGMSERSLPIGRRATATVPTRQVHLQTNYFDNFTLWRHGSRTRPISDRSRF